MLKGESNTEIFRNEIDTLLKSLAYSLVEIYANRPSDVEQNAKQPTDADSPVHVLFLQELRKKHLRLVENETQELKYRGQRVDAVNLIHDTIATLAQDRFEQIQRRS